MYAQMYDQSASLSHIGKREVQNIMDRKMNMPLLSTIVVTEMVWNDQHTHDKTRSINRK